MERAIVEAVCVPAPRGGAMRVRAVWSHVADGAFGAVCAMMLTGYLFYYAFWLGETDVRFGAIASAASICAILSWGIYGGTLIRRWGTLVTVLVLWHAVNLMGVIVNMIFDVTGGVDVMSELGSPILATGSVLAGVLVFSNINQSGWGFDIVFCSLVVVAIVSLLETHYGSQPRLAMYESFRLQARGRI